MLDLIDESFVVAAPGVVADRLRDRALTSGWWPDLELTVFQDRGDNGMRWTITGGLVGTAEVWLEPFGDGVVVHVYIRADITARGSDNVARTGPPGRLARRADRERRRRARAIKRSMWALRAELEAGRAPGEPRLPPESGTSRRPT